MATLSTIIGDPHAELCAVWHIVAGDHNLLHQLDPSDFSQNDMRRVFVALRDAKANLLEAENILKMGYTWLDWVNKAKYVGASYQVVEQLKRKRAEREAEAFRVSGKVEGYPDQLRSKGEEIGRMFMSKRMTVDDMAERLKSPMKKTPTGFPLMDYLCNGGADDGGVFVIAARPGVGKTTMAVNIAKNILSEGKTVYIASLEMPEEQILMRVAQSFWESDEAGVRKNIDDMKSLPGGLIIENAGYELGSLLSSMSLHLDADAFFVDYYQLIRLEGKEGHIQKLEIISNRLKEFAFTHKKPLFVLAQLNRMIETDKSNREPILADLRGCGALEQDASVVSFLWDKNGKDEMARSVNEVAAAFGTKPSEPDMKWLVKKNRNGKTGTIDMIFKPEIMTFSQK